MKAQIWRHPLNSHDTVFGVLLHPGDVIQKDDVYDSTSGNWEKAPCPGVILEVGCETLWIRPQ